MSDLYDDDPPVIRDADIEQAELEAAGREHARADRRMRRLREAGKLTEAAAECSHGWGYPLNSLAAQHNHDPHAGQSGFRCLNCGSRLSADPWARDCRVTFPCEWFQDLR